MNRGVLQNSPVQQMMATGNPSWWNINNLMRPPPMISSSPSSSLSSNLLAPLPNHHHHHDNDNNHVFHAHHQFNNMSLPNNTTSSSSWLDDHHHPTNHHQVHHQQQQLPESWSQLLLGGVILGEEAKKMEATNWEEQVVLQQQQPHLVEVKQENSVNSYNNNHNNNHNNNNIYGTTNEQEFRLAAAKASNWSHHLPQLNIQVSSPQSCVTSFSTSGNNLLDFSSSISSDNNLHPIHPPPAPDRTSECNSSTATGGVAKKAKVQSSSTQSTTPAFKVRKEKLGDRITALHQLVSPFGKTDTASVLLEAIGYIRFLQSQIEALSLPYLNSGAGNKRQQSHALLNDNCLKRKGGPDQDSSGEEAKDLKSRGLCLVPLSCTLHVGSDNGADYWAPALGGGFR